MVDVVGVGVKQSVGFDQNFAFKPLPTTGAAPRYGKSAEVEIQSVDPILGQELSAALKKQPLASVQVNNINNKITYQDAKGKTQTVDAPQFGQTKAVDLGNNTTLTLSDTKDGFDVQLSTVSSPKGNGDLVVTNTTVHGLDSGKTTVDTATGNWKTMLAEHELAQNVQSSTQDAMASYSREASAKLEKSTASPNPNPSLSQLLQLYGEKKSFQVG